MEKTINGVINHQFDLMETVAVSKELDLEKRVNLTSKLTSNIRQIAALELQHRRLVAAAPELAKDIEPLQLLKGDGKKQPAKKKVKDEETTEKETTEKSED